MGVEVNGSPDKYLAVLRGEAVQSDLKNGKMPVAFLGTCLETGILICRDETLLFELEKSAGRRIKPRVEPDLNFGAGASGASPRPHVFTTSEMPVVGADKPPFERCSSTREMYRQTVQEMDAAMAKSEILQGKDYAKSIVYDARKVWCTPELMKALTMDKSYTDKLRAAMYPVPVSFCTQSFDLDGKTYMVPYITVLDNYKQDGTTMLRKGEDERDYWYEGRTKISTTFYLTTKNRIGAMTGSTIHLYDMADFQSPEAIKSYMKELERAFENHWKGCASDAKKRYKANLKRLLDFLEPYANGSKPIGNPKDLMMHFIYQHKDVLGADTINVFVNIKTGETFYGCIRHNVKEIRKYGNGWNEVLDVTNCQKDGITQRSLIESEFERQRPGSVAKDKAVADESLRRLHRKMMKTEGLVERASGYVDVDGEDEYMERDFSI